FKCLFNLGGTALGSRKKLFLLLSLIAAVTLLSGCTEINKEITAESTGIWNTVFVYPMSWLITYFAELFTNNENVKNFGLAIIIVTVIIRIILLPLNVKQLKSSKAMQDIQPELKEIQ